jgi:hypothetical protein
MTGPTGPTGSTGPTGPQGNSGQLFTNQFSVQLAYPPAQSLSTGTTGTTGSTEVATTITNWFVNAALGDYNQGGGLNLSSGIYTVPVSGYYHVFATISVTYDPQNASTSYGGQLSTNAMQLVFAPSSGMPFLITAYFFSTPYAAVGGFNNNTGINTYDTATLASDLYLTAGDQYEMQVYNPFLDSTVVTLLANGTTPITGVFCRWSMHQFA